MEPAYRAMRREMQLLPVESWTPGKAGEKRPPWRLVGTVAGKSNSAAPWLQNNVPWHLQCKALLFQSPLVKQKMQSVQHTSILVGFSISRSESETNVGHFNKAM